MLYDLLAKVYELYIQSKEGDKADSSKRAWLIEQCEEREIVFKAKKPSLIQLITELVFYDSLADSLRVNSYERALYVQLQQRIQNRLLFMQNLVGDYFLQGIPFKLLLINSLN